MKNVWLHFWLYDEVMSDIVHEAEQILEAFDSAELCRACLHPKASHIHGLMACCWVGIDSVRATDHVTATTMMRCSCEGLR